MVIIMHVHLNVFGLELPGYGTAIMIGIVLASLIGGIHIKRRGLDINDFIILETIGVFFGFLGAKLLYLIVSFKDIDWSRLSEPAYLSYVLSAGFVFYGGIILAAVAVFIAGKLNKIDTGRYFREVVFLVPFAHGFGRIGCYFAGCCFGVPYSGPLAVTFPEGSSAPAGISPSSPSSLWRRRCCFSSRVAYTYSRESGVLNIPSRPTLSLTALSALRSSFCAGTSTAAAISSSTPPSG